MKRILMIAFLALFTSTCTGEFIAGYDAQIEQRGHALRNKVHRFLSNLERTAGTPAAAYDQHTGFYAEARQGLKALREAAAQLPRNGITVDAVGLIERNLDRIETMHRAGLTAPEVPIIRDLLDTQFRLLLHLERAKLRGQRGKEVAR
jgi:hypothetical protein